MPRPMPHRFDRIVDKNQDIFILGIYEETYVEDMDWCPESAYQYSFGVKNQKAINVSFEFLAG